MIGPMLPAPQNLARLYERKLAAPDELKKSLLHRAFRGELIMDKGGIDNGQRRMRGGVEGGKDGGFLDK